ncbi:acetyl-CoA carboxylase biotin carboxyl carrier protein, partial [Lactobacillus sp. XV13L]|nr:acetyl-CoA carboxylase biotin carboxyl carrier protein [Lactobacillus sp. XV13L]
VGENVSIGDKLCTIEAMKKLSEVKSNCCGIVNKF